MDVRDVAEAAATRAATPLMAKAGCVIVALAVLGIVGLGMVSIIGAGAAKQASDSKGGAQCETPGIPDLSDLGNVPKGILAQQVHHAKIIDRVAQERGLSGRASLIALMTGLQESGLQNLDHGHADSLGLFQQRPSQGWGTPAEVRNPPHSAGLFFGGNAGRPPGLVDIRSWQLMEPGRAAQAVQRSAHPTFYSTRRGQAEQIARQAGINLSRLGSGGMPSWAPSVPPGLDVPETGDGGCESPDAGVGAPFHDATAGWPPEVKNPRSTAEAIEWAKRQPAKRQGIWWRRCLAFTAIVFGWNVSGVESAAIHYRQMPAHMKHNGSRDVPPGALMYWDTGMEWGHVAVYLGDGQVISNDIRRPGYLDIVPAAEIESKWGAKYLGWAPPYFPKGS
ncbi:MULTISPECIES: peptidase M23 [unclassified Streptomyces]|uniref:peptidase M23 n=1 Tax=unclassified Streptomyces TaxID=2593676 RepID=UPI00364E2817